MQPVKAAVVAVAAPVVMAVTYTILGQRGATRREATADRVVLVDRVEALGVDRILDMVSRNHSLRTTIRDITNVTVRFVIQVYIFHVNSTFLFKRLYVICFCKPHKILYK